MSTVRREEALSEAVARVAGRRDPEIFPGHVYFIIADEGPVRVKVGFSIDPQKRLRQLRSGAPYLLKLVASFPAERADERVLHAALTACRAWGEWYRESALTRITELLEGGLFA